jgi:hypothetical protein
MTGIVDFRTELLDENGNPITALNPLPTTGGGGGGGSLLSDVLLTDASSALFVGRDNGTTVTYFNLNTNAVYTPSGTIQAAGGGGGSGSLLSDVLLTDSSGALFVARDNGTAITYFNLNTNVVYTPVGTIQAAGLTNLQLRSAPVPVVDATNEASQQDMILLLTRMLNYLNAPQGYDKSLQRQRSTAVIESGTVTNVTTVGTVTTVTNQTSMGGIQGQILVNADNLSAWALTVRSRIT